MTPADELRELKRRSRELVSQLGNPPDPATARRLVATLTAARDIVEVHGDNGPAPSDVDDLDDILESMRAIALRADK